MIQEERAANATKAGEGDTVGWCYGAGPQDIGDRLVSGGALAERYKTLGRPGVCRHLSLDYRTWRYAHAARLQLARRSPAASAAPGHSRERS